MMSYNSTYFSEFYTRKCPVCNLLYAGDDPADILDHGQYCANFVEAVTYLDYKPNFYKQREKFKSEAYKVLLKNDSEEDDIESLVFTAETLIMQYFDRSLHAAIIKRYYKKHPVFEDYIAMVIGHIHSVPEHVRKELIKIYDQIDGEIAPGSTYWFPKYSKDRRMQFEYVRTRR